MIRVIKEHTFFDDFLNKEIVVIDLGACRGEFINEINELFKIKKAILVEANSTNFKQLIAKENFTLYNNAISSVNDELIDFFEDTKSPYNGSNVFNYFNGVKHKISTINLNKIIKDNSIDYIDILKIDVEGAEYDVLENLDDEIYLMIKQITVEFHDFVNPELKPKTMNLIKKIESLGFKKISNPIDYMYNSENYDVLFYRD